MKKIFTLLTSLVLALAIHAQDAPLYTAKAQVCQDEDWDSFVDARFPDATGVTVDVYDGYVVVHSLAGVEGYDLMVEFDEDDNVLSVTPIQDGVEGNTIEKGYCTFNTGLTDDYRYMQAYLAEGYCYAGTDPEDNSGYVFLIGYNAAAEYVYYNLEWPVEEEELPEGCLYISRGEVTETEGWGVTLFPYVKDVKVEAYEGYFIVRGFAGVEGYDLMVECDEDDNILSVTPITDGEEGDTYTTGYTTLYTGRDDINWIQAYLASGYSYAGLYDDESGYLLLSCFIDSDWSYYYLTWPQSEDGPSEWVNPFEQEATLLYSAVGRVESIVDEEGTAEEDAWGESVLPTIENVKVDVYDTYIHIHALGGVEGYDAKVAYNANEEVLSIIGIVNGVESDPCRAYLYLSTGLDDYDIIQAYTNYSYAGTYSDNSGYVTLAGYIYENGTDKSDWSYYNLTWPQDDTAIHTTTAPTAPTPLYNLQGQRVNTTARPGLYIQNGKKIMVK